MVFGSELVLLSNIGSISAVGETCAEGMEGDVDFDSDMKSWGDPPPEEALLEFGE